LNAGCRVPHVSILRHGFAGCGSGQQEKQILRLRLRMTSRKSAATEYRGPSTTLGDNGNGGRVPADPCGMTSKKSKGKGNNDPGSLAGVVALIPDP